MILPALFEKSQRLIVLGYEIHDVGGAIGSSPRLPAHPRT